MSITPEAMIDEQTERFRRRRTTPTGALGWRRPAGSARLAFSLTVIHYGLSS
jgi:hypothetical protein